MVSSMELAPEIFGSDLWDPPGSLFGHDVEKPGETFTADVGDVPGTNILSGLIEAQIETGLLLELLIMTEPVDVAKFAQEECGSEIGDTLEATNNGILREPCSIVCQSSEHGMHLCRERLNEGEPALDGKTFGDDFFLRLENTNAVAGSLLKLQERLRSTLFS